MACSKAVSIAARRTEAPPGSRMDGVGRDLRSAVRFLSRNPTFSTVVVVTIAAAIGISATVFTAVNAVLLRPLPFNDPARLVHIVPAHDGVDAPSLSAAELDEYREHSEIFAAVASYFRQPEDRYDVDTLRRFVSVPVSTNFFDTLGVMPERGRTFLPSDTSESHVVVISHGFWQRRFGGRADVVGQTLRFDGAPYTVIGVMPPLFHHVDGLPADVWTPMWRMFRPTDRRDAGLARLRSTASLPQAQARLDLAGLQREQGDRTVADGWRVRLVPLDRATVGQARDALWILLAGVGLVTLIACANVGNMLVARNMARRHEFQVHLALGARRGRLVREAVTESAVLATLGAVAGAVVTMASVHTLVRLAPATWPRIAVASMDSRVWLWLLGITAIVSVLCSIAPAFALWRLRASDVLADMVRTPADRATRRMRAVTVIAQFAFATMLVMGAGLMIRTLVNLHRVDLGFRPDDIMTVYIRPGWGASRQGPNMALYYQELRERLAQLPGVRAVGAAKGLPLSQDVQRFEGEITTDVPRPDGTPVVTTFWRVVPGYFETLEIPLLAGRYFEPVDDVEARNVTIVSAALARRLFGEADPIGRRVSVNDVARGATVVGVVGDIRTTPGQAPRDTVYLTGTDVSARLTINFAIRTDGDPATIAPRVRDEIRAVEPNVAILEISTLQDARDAAIGHPRFFSALLNVFGAAGLLLAMVGIYGLGTHAVVQRRHEIGVRMAVGADRSAIVRLILGSSLGLAAAGATCGVAAALLTTKYLSSLLFGVSPTDPLMVVASVVLLLATAAVASYLPARVAARLDPSRLLRT
jgi:putative ABC transport system permease protein